MSTPTAGTPVPAANPGHLAYLPGLDGLRALSVLAVIVYHANKSWLGGGFLGVEVFFVISGYLITTLLLIESERTGSISLRQFWVRRARRLLPALWTMLVMVVLWCAAFEREALGQLRGDVVAAVLYGFNWFQVWMGTSYFGQLGLVPLRHLWSLAVEEQFYLVWPVLIAVLLRVVGRRSWLLGLLFLAATGAVAAYVATTYTQGVPGTVLETPGHYLNLFGQPVLRLDFLLLGTLGRAGGLFIGASLAFWFRPSLFVMTRPRAQQAFVSTVGMVGLGALGYLMVTMRDVVEGTIAGGTRGYDPLFRGGFLMVGIASVAAIASAVHPGTIQSGWLLGNRVLAAIGRRSYGLYLYHWPVFQFYRGVAGRRLDPVEFVALLAVTAVVTEMSYRFIESPIREGGLSRIWASLRGWDPFSVRRPVAALAMVAIIGFPAAAAATLATAPLRLDEISQSLADNEDAVTDVLGSATTLPPDPGTTVAPGDTVAPSPGTTTLDGQPIPILAIGDSVMLGASDILVSRGVTVDAMKSRPFRQALEIVNYLKSVGRLGEVVIIHLGTNNYVDKATLDEIMVPLADVDLVVFLTVHVPDKAWQDPNNLLIRDLPNRYGNVKILDWFDIASKNLGYLYKDRTHLTEEGQVFYSDVLMQAIGR